MLQHLLTLSLIVRELLVKSVGSPFSPFHAVLCFMPEYLVSETWPLLLSLDFKDLAACSDNPVINSLAVWRAFRWTLEKFLFETFLQSVNFPVLL